MQHCKLILVLVLNLCTYTGLLASPPPSPLNDTVCNAVNLGTLDIPGPCATYPYGDTIVVNGTTLGAGYNTVDFTPMHCFAGGSPDVWYRVVSTGNRMYIEMSGTGGLDSFFIKLHHSQGSCLNLVPLQCEQTTNGFMQASFYTPDIGGEYYLQIGGSHWNESGNFSFAVKSYNECSECVKNADLELSPSPWFGHYGTSDTVTMCATVERWELITSSELHAIVPVFGNDWDLSTLTPVQAPSSPNSGWGWFTAINTPVGQHNGYFFDSNSNGDPSDNAGDPGQIFVSRTACWKIATMPFCQNYDLSVDVYIFSDDETGNHTGNNECDWSPPIHAALSGWCCASPDVTIMTMSTCSSGTVLIDPAETSATDSFSVVVYNDSLQIAYTFPTSFGTQVLTGVFNTGNFLIESYNYNTGCISYATVNILPQFEVSATQTLYGCSNAAGAAVINVTGNSGPYTYQWLNIPSINWVDSMAFNLNEGFVVYTVTDAVGCTVTDSVYIQQLDGPDAEFGYADKTYCNTADTIQVYFPPFTGGGTYSLLTPLSAGITIDSVTGIISLNNTTLSPPFEIQVKYSISSICPDSWVDSVMIMQQPAPPVPSGSVIQTYCIGNTPPLLQVSGSGIPGWVDYQTGGYGFTNSYTPPLSSSTAAGGPYIYAFATFTDLTFGCSSAPTIFYITAQNYPNVAFSGDTVICAGETALLFASTNNQYQYTWSPPPTSGVQTSPVTSTSPTSSQTYTCSVTDGACTTTGNVAVTVTPADDCGFAVYSGITPNGDGVNDRWIIDGAAPDKEMSVWIYDRWGALVWSGNNYDNVNVYWGGQGKNNELLSAGTYFYLITQRGERKESGWIELSR